MRARMLRGRYRYPGSSLRDHEPHPRRRHEARADREERRGSATGSGSTSGSSRGLRTWSFPAGSWPCSFMAVFGTGIRAALITMCLNQNIQFWVEKFKKNVVRDKRVQTGLEGMGWRVAVIWERETADSDGLRKRLKELLGRR